MNDFHDVLKFHQRFDLPCGEFSSLPSEEVFRFRYGFLIEEIKECWQEYYKGNLVGVVDALVDMVYVGIGTAFFIGTPRNGPQSTWPTFRTACMAMANHGVIELHHRAPSLLPLTLQRYCMHQLRSSVSAFRFAYEATFELEMEDSGACELMIVSLKEYVDSAYKMATMMHTPWESCWRHVQEANMSKKRACADGSDSKRHSRWDVVKPFGFVRPEAKIATELRLNGWKIPETMTIDNVTGKVEVEA